MSYAVYQTALHQNATTLIDVSIYFITVTIGRLTHFSVRRATLYTSVVLTIIRPIIAGKILSHDEFCVRVRD